MAPKKKSSEEIRKSKRECERRRRARIKADHEQYALAKAKERERWHKRKQDGKIPSIKDLTPRAQRIQKKKWREQTKLSRDRKKDRENLLQRLNEDTPSETSESDSDHRNVNQQVMENPVAPILRSQKEGSHLSSSTGSSVSSSSSKQSLAGAKRSRRSRNMRNYLINKQKQTIQQQRRQIHNMAKKYSRLLQAKSAVIVTRTTSQRKKTAIKNYLEKDENSKSCPGKKDCITKKKLKKQKRYLCDNLKRLHEKYNNSHPASLRVSYQTFCRLKPFWIVTPKVTERDTCLCIVHENTRLIVDKLKREKIITEKSIEEVCDSVICAQKSYECYHRTCDLCSWKSPRILEFESVPITYKQWITKKETRIIKGKDKIVQRTLKEEMACQTIELVKAFLLLVDKFLVHQYNIFHQYRAIDYIKNSLSEEEALVHVDFSENYQTKYTNEAQSVHFGASREQISLHTGVIYYKNSEKLEKFCFCSASACLRHDASAIYAHLMYVLKRFIQEHPIRVIHLLSDGPSNQYRNKNMIYFFTQHLVNALAVTAATWNFSEAGHGKGAPDGVGAVVKRTADSLVAHGTDIPNLETFLTALHEHVRGVQIYNVQEKDITDADEFLPKLKTIPGTLKVHQYTWSRKNPRAVYLRELTCTECSVESKCSHFDFNAIHKFKTPPPSPEQHHLDAGLSSSGFTVSVETVDKIVTGNWVVVRFCGVKSKTTAHFVGQVISIDGDGPAVKFTRNKLLLQESATFIWKEPEDISIVDLKEIECVLPEPTPTRRSELIFNYDFERFNIK